MTNTKTARWMKPQTCAFLMMFALVLPPKACDVKDSDNCQAVSHERMGGHVISCKGSCPAGQRCSGLQTRPTGTTNPWTPSEADPAAYDSKLDYQCSCIK